MSATVTLPTRPPLPPWYDKPTEQWVTVGEFATLWNKHRNTIRQWCESGFLLSIGFSTYQDIRGIWYIRLS